MTRATYNHAAVAERLETVLIAGQAFISWNEISLWWNFRRIDKKPWRDIHELWNDLWAQQPFCTQGAPTLNVRGTDRPTSGGVWIVRPYIKDIDGKEMSLKAEGLAAKAPLSRRLPARDAVVEKVS